MDTGVANFIRNYESTIRTIARLRPDQPIDFNKIDTDNFARQMHGSNHYDWWAFPIDETSQRPEFAVLPKQIAELTESSEYMNYYRWFSARYIESWGEFASSAGSDIRMYKVLKSWLLFEFDDQFTYFVKRVYPKSSGYGSRYREYLDILLHYRCLRFLIDGGEITLNDLAADGPAVLATIPRVRSTPVGKPVCSMDPYPFDYYRVAQSDVESSDSISIRRVDLKDGRGSSRWVNPFDRETTKPPIQYQKWLYFH